MTDGTEVREREQTRFLVTWCEWAAALAAAHKVAIAQGTPIQKFGGEHHVSDYVDLGAFEASMTLTTFSAAVKWCAEVAERDTWHCPRIYHQHRREPHDELGTWTEWESDKWWEFFANEPPPVFADGMDVA
jgi:hypothetical protein